MTLENQIVYPIFSTPLYHANVSDYVNDVIDLDNIPYNNFFDNTKQVHTLNSIDQNILLSDKFSTVKKHIDSAMSEFVYNQLKISKKLTLKLVCSWMAIGFPECRTSTHMHNNSMFSGVFYIKSNDKAGNLIFCAEQAQMTYCSPTVRVIPEEFNILNSLSWSIAPKTNDILIFPSHLLHGVSENLSNEIRCVISFNYFLSGLVSEERTQVLNI